MQGFTYVYDGGGIGQDAVQASGAVVNFLSGTVVEYGSTKEIMDWILTSAPVRVPPVEGYAAMRLSRLVVAVEISAMAARTSSVLRLMGVAQALETAVKARAREKKLTIVAGLDVKLK